MPRDYYRRLIKMRIYATVVMISSLVVISSFVIGLAVWPHNIVVGLACICFFVLSSSMTLYFLPRFEQKQKRQDPWVLSAKKITLLDVLNFFEASEVMPNCYIGFIPVQKCNFRILIQHMQEYSKEMLVSQRQAANRKINQKYKIRHNHSMWDLHNMARLNIVVVEKISNELCDLVQKTNITVMRAECIFTIVFVLDSAQVVIPALNYGVTYSQIHRYELAVETAIRPFI